MKLSELYPSPYWRASDIGDDPVTLTMDSLSKEEMQDGQIKNVLSFQDSDKRLVLIKTNANAIGAVYGDDTDDWRGQPITLISVPVDYQGKQVDAIRVRARPPRQAQRPAQPSNVRSGTASYGEAKGRAPVAPKKSLGEELEDEIPF